MAKRRSTPLTHMYVFDLESCDDVRFLDLPVPHQRAWLSGYMNLATGKIVSFSDLEHCMQSLLKEGGNQNIEVGVHNLSFDGSFIIPALVKLGYEPIDGKPSAGQFSVLISDRNQWYTIQVQVTRKRRVMFWDTAKLFPMALKFLPSVYNTPTHKLEEDDEFYNQIRELDHEPTVEEMRYFYNDLKVLQEVLLEHIKYEGLAFKKTQASQAFENFKASFKAWRLRFPSLSQELDQAIRTAYLGGISYVNPNHQEQVIEDVIGIDINSSYPYELSSKPLPYGHMIKELDGKHPQMNLFWVADAVVRFKLKKDCVPLIAKRQIKDKDFELENKDLKWLSDSNGLVEMTFCSIDYLNYQLSYDFEVVEWGISYHWAQKRHKEVANFVLINNKDKIEHRALANKLARSGGTPEVINEHLAKAQRAKINNNAFYGKFGEEIVKIGKVVEVNDWQEIAYVESREEVLSPYKRKFLPVAIATTAYARGHLVRIANILGDDFIYCDTDSLYFKRDSGQTKLSLAIIEKELVMDNLELGAWSIDGEYKRMKALRPKTYICEKPDGSLEVTCAGLPADKDAKLGEKKRSCFDFDNFHVGTIIKGGNGKLRPILTPTGKKLVPTDFELGKNKLFDF